MVVCVDSLITTIVMAIVMGGDLILFDAQHSPLIYVHSVGVVDNMAGVQQQNLPPLMGLQHQPASASQSAYHATDSSGTL